MWDHSHYCAQDWWNALPKTLRIVAFSEAVAQRAEVAGLSTLRLRYYPDPQEFVPARWDHGRVLLYWNRTGVFSLSFLKQLCQRLGVKKLLFRNQLDEGVASQAAYSLPAILGNTVVEELPMFQEHADYLKAVEDVNIYLAPRQVEGLGVSFLEAMSRGCAVLSLDSPTMNEYITHNYDGFLFKESKERLESRLKYAVQRRMARMLQNKSFFFGRRIHTIDNWQALEKLDCESVGKTARRKQYDGYQMWQQQIQQYAQFILGE